MNGFNFIIQLICALIMVVGFALIIEMFAGMYYGKAYLNDLDTCKKAMKEIDEYKGIIREYEDDALIEAITMARNNGIFKGILGIMLLVGGFIPLFII